jgi:hypothetical protein
LFSTIRKTEVLSMSNKKLAKWGTLVGSKTKLRRILTGEPIKEAPYQNLKSDLLYGAPAISAYTGLTERQVYHQQKALGLVRLGRTNEAA